jgi:hypothetical protein
MSDGIQHLETQLDDFNPAVRHHALTKLVELVNDGDFARPHEQPVHNLHGHTFFSYNCYGYSPSRYAWLAFRHGFEAVGAVDFDVVDALEEFHEACRMLNLRSVVSLESRVFVPEFSTRVINSPGEPGVAYHMAAGFTGQPQEPDAAAFLQSMRASSERRNRDLLARVNAFTVPVTLDYEKDVLPLTPKGNATERHIVMAYAKKAAAIFSNRMALAEFWKQKIGATDADLDLPDGPKLLNLIRAKTMKKGGVGYVQPGKDTFPLMADMNRFALQSGAIPMAAWLDGMSDGEKSMEELLRVSMSTGVAAFNIIPDRNYTPGKPDQKLQNLYDVVKLADGLHLPIIIGTELNSAGNKFVDRFDTEEIKPLVPIFRKGWRILYGHTVLQRAAGLGYCSEWAARNFKDASGKNTFFGGVGRLTTPATESRFSGIGPDTTPDEILHRLA